MIKPTAGFFGSLVNDVIIFASILKSGRKGPTLTIKFEAKTESKYNELKKYINDLLHSYKEIDWSFGVNIESLK